MLIAAFKCFNAHFVKRLALQTGNSNCFSVIIDGVMVLNLNSVVPMKIRFAHSKRHFALHKYIALMPVSKTTSLFNQKPPANGFKLNLKFYLSQIISLLIKIIGN